MDKQIVNLSSDNIIEMFEAKNIVKPENPIQAELNLRFEAQGRADTLRNSILSFLATGRYDTAAKELEIYFEHKSQHSAYRLATSKLFEHAIEIPRAMKLLTENKDLKSLPRAKRQDVLMRVKRLFENMKHVLMRLEQIENDLLVQDAKSVVWFIRSCTICVFSLIAVVAFIEAVNTLGRPLEVLSIEGTNWLFHLVGF
jgi:hypothetical protein